MKKTLLFIALFTFVLSLNSCSKDDVNESNYTQEDLTGTWVISKTVFENTDITSQASDCDKRENIIIDNQGNTTWKYTAGANDECLSATRSVKTIELREGKGSFNIEDLLDSAWYTGEFLSKNRMKITQYYELGSVLKTEKEFTKQ